MSTNCTCPDCIAEAPLDADLKMEYRRYPFAEDAVAGDPNRQVGTPLSAPESAPIEAPESLLD